MFVGVQNIARRWYRDEVEHGLSSCVEAEHIFKCQLELSRFHFYFPTWIEKQARRWQLGRTEHSTSSNSYCIIVCLILYIRVVVVLDFYHLTS